MLNLYHTFSEREFEAMTNCSCGFSAVLYMFSLCPPPFCNLPLNSLIIIHSQVDISALHGICCPTSAKLVTLLGSCA